MEPAPALMDQTTGARPPSPGALRWLDYPDCVPNQSAQSHLPLASLRAARQMGYTICWVTGGVGVAQSASRYGNSAQLRNDFCGKAFHLLAILCQVTADRVEQNHLCAGADDFA